MLQLVSYVDRVRKCQLLACENQFFAESKSCGFCGLGFRVGSRKRRWRDTCLGFRVQGWVKRKKMERYVFRV